MRPHTIPEVAATVHGELLGPRASGDLRVRGVAIDSRTVQSDDLFVAIAGEHTDGHRHVHEAFSRGASAALVSSAPMPEWSGPVVRVSDTVTGLSALAAAERRHMDAVVIGVTGSTGKTCTKDFIAAVLGPRFRTAANPASFNNEVGLPFTLLSAPDDVQAVVCEMGARGAGHIRWLCDIARPRIGVLTNVGVAHMELFGSRDAIAAAKAELVEALPDDGLAVLNGDDAVVGGFASRTRARVLTYGRAAGADVRAANVSLDGRASARFDLITPEKTARVELAVAGEHMVANALAAATVGWALGVDADAAAAALRDARVSAGRMELFDRADGVTVLDDAYNANPTSVAAALEAARSVAGDRRWVAVLGEMAELGPIAQQEHERVGELLAADGAGVLVAVGPWGSVIAAAAERGGMVPDHIVVSADVEEAARIVPTLIRADDVVLVKASRAVGLERVVRALLGRSATNGGPDVVVEESS